MKKTIITVASILSLLILVVNIYPEVKAYTKVKQIKMEAPKDYHILSEYISYDGSSWGYLMGKRVPKAEYDYTKYDNYYIVTHTGKKFGPIKYKNDPKDKENNLWSTEFDLYITPNGNNYVLSNLIDGSWLLLINGEKINYSMEKPVVSLHKNSLYVRYYNWRTSSYYIVKID